jgi:hypothetical protein
MTELDTTRIANETGVEESKVADVVARHRLDRGDLTDYRFHALVQNVIRTKVSVAQRDAREDLSVVRIQPRAD